jgi:hypothetical protein
LSQQQCEQLSNIVDWLKETDANDNPSTPEWIEAAEELLNQYQPQQIQEKSKSGIEINPENKGKFTATMKRTGKSAEELSHSKNPLTRKRAQFALNSKKWNKKKNANESTIGRIIREELENMSADTDAQNTRPKWMDILDAINAAGVNHAPKTQQSQATPKPEPEPMQQQTQQTEPEPEVEQEPVQQPVQQKPLEKEYQIGKYVFYPYSHTLTGPNGSVRIRPTYSNYLAELCRNMGEMTDLPTIFGITDLRNIRTNIHHVRKLFAEDPNVRIDYDFGKAKLVAGQEGLNESEEPDEAIDYFGDFVDILNECGWAYYDFQGVQSKSTGKTGTRFSLDKYNANACTAEELKERILQTIPQQYVVFGNAQHRYAPELNRMTVVILDA